MTATPQRFVIFYSWQSDLENSTNRGFLQDALEKAARNIRSDDSITVEPVIDRDTFGVPGSPDIASTIYDKIDRAGAVISDVSIVTTGADRVTPNPNVLLELGYAIHAKGWSRILMVMNTHNGPIQALPFDLRGRRVVPYDLTPGGEKAPVRQELVRHFEAAIRGFLAGVESEIGVRIDPPSLAAQAEAAIEAEKKNRLPVVRKFLSNAIDQVTNIAPDLAKGSKDPDQLRATLEEARGLSAHFARVAKIAAEMDDEEAILALVDGLEPLAGKFHWPRGQSGVHWDHMFDFYRFIGLEWLLILVAVLLRERRWKVLKAVLIHRFYVNNKNGTQEVGSVGVEYFENGISTLDSRANPTNAGELLRVRAAVEPLARYVESGDLVAADYLLFMKTDLPKPNTEEWPAWRCRVAVLSSDPPRFLIDAVRVATAREIAAVVGLESPELLRDRLLERGRLPLQAYGHEYRMRLPMFHFDANMIATVA